MDRQKITEYLEEIMELEPGELNEDMVLAEIDEWDSLSRLSLLAEAEDKFGKVLRADSIKEFLTVKDICDYFLS